GHHFTLPKPKRAHVRRPIGGLALQVVPQDLRRSRKRNHGEKPQAIATRPDGAVILLPLSSAMLPTVVERERSTWHDMVFSSLSALVLEGAQSALAPPGRNGFCIVCIIFSAF